MKHAISSRANAQPRLNAAEQVERAKLGYQTKHGKMIHGTIEQALSHRSLKSNEGKVDLILTSPPFPLVRKKRYGNKTGMEYIAWLEYLARMALNPT